jgi:hypothetical protein
MATECNITNILTPTFGSATVSLAAALGKNEVAFAT